MAQSKDTELLPVYLIVGDDELKRTHVMSRLRTRMERFCDFAFNYDELDAQLCCGEDILAACNTVPFAGEKRLVYVYHVEKLKKADADQVIDYLQRPSATTVLALQAEKLAKNSRLYKAILKISKTAIIECDTPKSYELARIVRAMGPTHGITLTDDAVQKLIELIGDNTVRLDNEIQKIALAHNGNQAVNEKEVESLVARTSQIKPWEFVDAFSARDLQKCISYFGKMESSSPYSLLPMCVNRIRELMCAQSYRRRGNMGQFASALGLPDWRVKHHDNWAQRFTRRELMNALLTSRNAEQAMKSGRDPDTVFLDWIIATLS